MARSIKCKRCGKTLLPEERYKYDNNSYCVDCYKKVERDANEYKELMRYIFDIFLKMLEHDFLQNTLLLSSLIY